MTRTFKTMTLKASLYTFIKYKSEFRRELLSDLTNGDWKAYFRILYVLCCEGMGIDEPIDTFLDAAI